MNGFPTTARKQNVADPKLVILQSPYRAVIDPIAKYVMNLEKENPDRQIAVVISELVERHWLQRLLHNQRARTLTALLTRNGDQRIVVVNVPWYFDRNVSPATTKEADYKMVTNDRV